MNIPANLQYLKTHEWLSQEGKTAKVGISDYAQSSLGDIVFVTLPVVGDKVTVGESFAEVESVKAVSNLYAPVSGTITAVNESLSDSPELLNSDCYGQWIIEVAVEETSSELLSSTDYQALCH